MTKTNNYFSALRVEVIDGNKFKLTENFICYIDNQKIIVPRGFTTDFSSIPKVLKLLFTGKEIFNPAACVHDFLYSTHVINNKYINRKQADQILIKLLQLSNAPKFSSKIIYYAVRLFGASHWSLNTL